MRHRLDVVAAEDVSLPERGNAVSAALQANLAHDGYCLIGFDPTTHLRVFHTSQHALLGVERELTHNEHVEHDLNRFTSLGRRDVPVGTLGAGGIRERHSPRLHEMLRPQGFGHEMRIALTHGGTLWGALVLVRERGGRPFDDTEIETAAACIAPLTAAVRAASRDFDVEPSCLPLPPAVVLVNADGTAAAITADANLWLDDMSIWHRRTDEHPLPWILLEVAAATRTMAEPNAHPSATLRCRSGRWLTVSGSSLGNGQVAVVLHSPTGRQLLPIFSAQHDLTRREGQVVHEIISGRPLKQIARRLHLSQHTVDDHLKNIYRKTRSNGRNELSAKLT